jgi:nitrite reductase/ring-hydroxylating ferredoxin subunit
VVRTLEGAGAGTEIWTGLSPAAPGLTVVEVDFQVPDVPPERADELGAAYTRLYTRLWDEDEGMMVRRSRELARRARAEAGVPGSVELGPLAELRAALPLRVALAGRAFRVVEVGGELAVHSTVCPHRLGPLEACPVEDGAVACPWHGYRFDVRSGRSLDGRRLRLAPAPRLEVDAGGHARLVLP